MIRAMIPFVVLAIGMGALGCGGEEPKPTASEKSGRDTAPSTKAPPSEEHKEQAQDSLGLPPGHPPIGDVAPKSADTPAGGQDELTFTPPDDWKELPARMMTLQVFELPKAEGDAEAPDVAISTLAKSQPWDMMLDFWCTRFAWTPENTCADATRSYDLDGTTYPTRVADMTGAYQGGMMQRDPSAAPKENYRQIVAQILVGDTPWYAKLTGPAASVELHEQTFLSFVRAAK